MKLIMTLLVRDEIDIIAANMDFHLARGVDHVVAIDNGSVDGTRELLDVYEKAGVATVFDQPVHDFSQSQWVTQAAIYARDKLQADWIINNDADEFWATPLGTLKDVARQAEGPLLHCVRRNMICAHEDLGTQTDLSRLIYRCAEQITPPRMGDIFSDPLPAPYFYLGLQPKAMLRAKGLVKVHSGNHSADFEPKTTPLQAPVEIFHFPIRSRPQFTKKITQGAAAYAANTHLALGIGWHWRRWGRMYQEQGLDAVLADALPSAAQLPEDVERGRVIADRRFDLAMVGSGENRS